MREFYMDVPTRSRVACTPPDVGDSVGWINGVNVPKRHRRRGVATRMLREVCADADEQGITLKLAVVATEAGLGGPGNRALAEWYRKLGFVWDGPRGYELGYMRRDPATKVWEGDQA